MATVADSFDDIINGLLFSEFKWLEEVKTEIEETCDITTKQWWSDQEIRRAWEERENMTEEHKRKHWACVIALQVMGAKSGRKSVNKPQPVISPQGRKRTSGLSKTDSDRECENPPSVYIKIPFFEMFGYEFTSEKIDCIKETGYKLLDGCPSRKEIRKRKSYVMSYDKETNNAEWVYEILNKETLAETGGKSVQIGEAMQNQRQKGHLAAAANHMWCQEVCNDSCLFSNIVPQNAELNKREWKTLEGNCRNIITQDKTDAVRNVHVYTGPLYLRKEENTYVRETNIIERDGGKTVPTHLFKIIIVENNDGTVKRPICRILDNENPNLVEIKETFDNIVLLSGLEFTYKPPFKVRERTRYKKVTLKGEDNKGVMQSAEIKVRITVIDEDKE